MEMVRLRPREGCFDEVAVLWAACPLFALQLPKKEETIRTTCWVAANGKRTQPGNAVRAFLGVHVQPRAARISRQRRLNRSHRQLKAILCFQGSTFAAQRTTSLPSRRKTTFCCSSSGRGCVHFLFGVLTCSAVLCVGRWCVSCGWSKVMVSF